MTDPTRPKDLDRQPVAAATGTMPAASPSTDAEAPMTEAQAAELRELAERTGEAFDASLTQHQAEERLAYLRTKV
ncbi:DUF3072 domain-containing protein [Psychromarinibacter sp. C21-152]|uniref:DUF3072 domain-containing protein n=1 Tax=Psychromarinibacter sediminicola TaxID=3033385 RepID=A0AAE3T9P3_9RHOB|nr:DUF3072 domain-containing protein [Psychromarinibacter sediminicola]MDF0602840.1 DUF3072 domain-containing protein [Psychromarinibacter sediminicola]